MPTFRVVAAGSVLDDEYARALNAAGMQPISGHSQRTAAAPGGELPEVDTWAVLVDASDSGEASRRLSEVLDSINRPHTITEVAPFVGN